MKQRSREEEPQREPAPEKRPKEPRPLGGGYGQPPVRVAELEAWARLRVT